MAAAATTTAATIMEIAIAVLLCFGLASAPVAIGGCGGSTFVGAVPRPITASVSWGRRLVSISVAAEGEPSLAVPTSPLSWDESLTSVMPSTRQNASPSSVSTRLQWGQRFIVVAQAISLRALSLDAN